MASSKPGLLVLINNQIFDHLPERNGTGVDKDHLIQFFGRCGFNVFDEIYQDQKCSSILKIVQRVAKANLASFQCLVFAILSHGDNVSVHGKDSKYIKDKSDCEPKVLIKTLLLNFNATNCRSLRNKPKIFIIQACRGRNECAGVDLPAIETLNIGSNPATPQTGATDDNKSETDTTGGVPSSSSSSTTDPDSGAISDASLDTDAPNDTAKTDSQSGSSSQQSSADNLIINFKELAEPEFLIAYSTSEGDRAHRRDNIGTWFVYALMQVLNEYGRGQGLLSNLTRVNRLVAFLFNSKNGKQMPVFVSTLTDDIHFIPDRYIYSARGQHDYPHIASIDNGFRSLDGKYAQTEARNYCLIINNTDFKSTQLSRRAGSTNDAMLLTELFESKLNFEVISKCNLTSTEMVDEFKLMAEKDHTGRSCVVCIVLTYSLNRAIYGTDTSFSIDEVMEPFKGRLVGKPKFFIFQACDRTKKLDTVSVSATNARYRIPVVADFLTSFSSIPGQLAWKDDATSGSLFIKTLESVFRTHHEREDVVTMLTRVNKQLKTTDSSPVACIVSQLTKDFFLNPSSVEATSTTDQPAAGADCDQPGL